MINDKLRAPQVINQGSTLQRSTLTKLYVNKLESKLEQLQQSVLALGAILLKAISAWIRHEFVAMTGKTAASGMKLQVKDLMHLRGAARRINLC